MQSIDIQCDDEQASLELASKLAISTQVPCVIFLQGNLGVGKTTLSRGFIQAFGHQGIIKSPTYTLVEPYEFGSCTIYHFDLYRLSDPEELEYLGFRDYLTNNSICLIEWPEKASELLPEADLTCYIEHQQTGRAVHLRANTARGQEILKRLHDII